MKSSDAVLTIDQGNTKTKISVVSDGKILRTVSAPAPSLEEVVEIISEFEIFGAIYCSVAGIDVRFIESLRHLLQAPVEVFTHATPLPVGIDYATPQTLGLDRVAAAVYAAEKAAGRAALVVDAGTAITLDVTDAGGVFRGGNIAPGLALRLRSLHESTGQLPEISPLGPVPEFGCDTETAIRSGVVGGAACEILGTYANARERFAVSCLFLSGGDAGTILPLLENKINDINVVGDIVSLGLDLIFRYNDSLNNENQ